MLEKIAGIEQHYEQLGRDLEEVGNNAPLKSTKNESIWNH